MAKVTTTMVNEAIVQQLHERPVDIGLLVKQLCGGPQRPHATQRVQRLSKVGEQAQIDDADENFEEGSVG